VRLRLHHWTFAAAGAVTVVAVFSQTPPPAASAAPNRYVNPTLCGQCHAEIARTYRLTGMGRSFYRLGPQNVVEDFRSGKPFYHEPSKSYFAMLARDGKYYQRRWQSGHDGRETNVEEKQIDFVLGSGNRARTYLHLTNRNTLQQLPLGWYSAKGGYFAMNPGYDRADYQGSTRVIHYECMFCHNAYPQIPAGHQEPGAEAQYAAPIPGGIDCQRCHGPGQQHVDAAGRAGTTPAEIRAAIVNPARLSPERELEVCLQCHLETSSRRLPHSMLRLGRGPFSYQPGQPFGDFRLSFDRTAGQNQEFEIAHAAYRLRASECFLKSAGKLRCTSCHNPHAIAHGQAATRQHNAVCEGCHAAVSREPSLHAAGANCTGCHMPKRRTDDVIHVVMTDHKIVRRPPPGDPLAEKKEKHEPPSYRGEVALYYPEKPALTAETQLEIALAQVAEGSNRDAGIRQLTGLIEKYRPARAGYYSGLAEAYRAAGDRSKAAYWFDEAARRAPTSEIVQLQLGNVWMETGRWSKAEAAFRRAKALRSGDAAAWGLLGWVLWQQDKRIEAKTSLEAAVKLDPESTDLRNYLGSLYMGTGDAAAAEREFREAVKINPAVGEYRAKLAALLASRGEIAEASYQAKAAVEAAPDLAEARLLYGQLLLTRNDLAGGIRELEAAVRLKPASGRAQYELGVALAQTGNRARAVEHLRLAAQSPEQDAKAAAQQVLRSLGQ
jgi:predicted CXXCH cytochrome family protein